MEYYEQTLNFGKVARTIGPRLPSDELILDIETKKILLPKPFAMPNGQLLNKVWQPSMIGFLNVNKDGDLICRVEYGWLKQSWTRAFDFIEPGTKLHYSATREFDEMVLLGCFTNARRAHLPAPGPWPHLDGERFEFINERKNLRSKLERGGDIQSKRIAFWNGEDDDAEVLLIIIHCMRDCVQLYGELGYGMPADAKEFLTNLEYAQDLIAGEHDAS